MTVIHVLSAEILFHSAYSLNSIHEELIYFVQEISSKLKKSEWNKSFDQYHLFLI